MKKSLVVLTVLAILVLLVGVVSASADSDTSEYRWFAGVPVPGGGDCDPNTAIPCPDVAWASNGDNIEIAGEGTLSVHPKSVTGSGTFTHNFAGGGSVSGTWTATQLLSFKSYGSSPAAVGLPPTWEAGKAIIRVHLVADGMEADAILTVGCILPEVKVPGGVFEGSRLNVQGGPNFNNADFGATLFLRQQD